MARPRIHESDRERRQAQNARRRSERHVHDLTFIGVDGEGVTDSTWTVAPNGDIWREHRYVLLGVGQEQTEDPSGLGYGQIFSFLYDQYEANKDAVFVGFFLGYDFTQWFKTLPETRAWYLLSEQGRAKRARSRSGGNRTPFAVRCDGWEFDILGMKRFRLRREGEKGWMYINDAGAFFQTSLMKAIDPKGWQDPIVTEREYETLLEGKSKRDVAALDSDMRRYNALENDVLARLMARLNQGFTKAGIRLRKDQWFGPGQAAQAWLALQPGVPTAILLSDWYKSESARLRTSRSGDGIALSELGRLTYYGGWFEIFCHGHIPGHSWEYDINSAYPYIISKLPCLIHGEWKRHVGARGIANAGRYAIVHGNVYGTDPFIGVALHRTTDGRILRPQSTGGYFWYSELEASTRAKLIDHIEIEEWWEYVPCNCPPPLRGMVGLYDERLRLGKNTPTGKAYKLIYNSAYGKFAQSIGHPKYGNSIYASLITSGCREMIVNAIATHPERSRAVVMVATDGVYFTSPHPTLPRSEKLGDWEETVHENLTLFKPGVYWDDKARDAIRDGIAPQFKARGISAVQFARCIDSIDKVFTNWNGVYPEERDPATDRQGFFPQIVYRSGFSMVTCLQALQRRKWDQAGRVYDVVLVQDADPVEKRHSSYYDRDRGLYRSAPYRDRSPFESTPYDRNFGQPDPDEYGITPDGTVLETWRGLTQP